jgi:DNA polymerase elongation subunit (family B)
LRAALLDGKVALKDLAITLLIIMRLQEHLEGLRAALLDGKVALKDLAITKQLTKDPSDYADKKALPHVQVLNLLVKVKRSTGVDLYSDVVMKLVILDRGYKKFRIQVQSLSTGNTDKYFTLPIVFYLP